MKPSALLVTILRSPGSSTSRGRWRPRRGGRCTSRGSGSSSRACRSSLSRASSSATRSPSHRRRRCWSPAGSTRASGTRSTCSARIAFAGLFLYMDRPLFLVALIPVAVMQFVRARQESKALEARFGDEYRAYKARTWF